MGCLLAMFSWLFPRLALLDIGHWSAGYTQRNQIPGTRGA
jgi:hypothetical protein